MKPTILKVFSVYPQKKEISLELTKNDRNNIIKISNLNTENNNQLKSDRFSTFIDDNINDEFHYDNLLNNEYGNYLNKDLNVLEDFYRFQERRNALLDNRKLNGSVTQQKTAFERPNYSYTQLIYMAIENSALKALTVNGIYTWCEQNFPYYASATHGWKNSLRHNLSINKCFKKVSKLGVGGRGSLWVVDPKERQHLVSTMHRSNVTPVPSSVYLRRSTLNIDPVQVDDVTTIMLSEIDDYDNDDRNVDCDCVLGAIVEKSVEERTDTRCAPLSVMDIGCTDSAESDTDYNDWQRSTSSLAPLYPIKTHLYTSASNITPIITIINSLDHNYSLPELSSVLSNPSSVFRHSFISSSSSTHPVTVTQRGDSFSPSNNTSSYDYNDEDWPRTPSPISSLIFNNNNNNNNNNNTEDNDINNHQQQLDIEKSTGKKRGRPKKKEFITISKSLNQPIKKTMKMTNQKSSGVSINNMYNLNTFFNSL